MGGNVRKAVAEGRADAIPIFLHEIPLLFRRGLIPVDVALIHVMIMIISLELSIIHLFLYFYSLRLLTITVMDHSERLSIVYEQP